MQSDVKDNKQEKKNGLQHVKPQVLFEKAPRPTNCTMSSVHNCPLVSCSPSVLEPTEFDVDFIPGSYSTEMLISLGAKRKRTEGLLPEWQEPLKGFAIRLSTPATHDKLPSSA